MDYLSMDEIYDPQVSPDRLRALMAELPSYTPTGQIAIATAIAQNPGCPADILDALADSQGKGHVAIMANVVRNPGTQESTLLKIAGASKDKEVLRTLADNPHATSAVLLRLTQDKSALAQGWIEPSIKAHPQVTPEILQVLSQQSAVRDGANARQTQRFEEEQARIRGLAQKGQERLSPQADKLSAPSPYLDEHVKVMHLDRQTNAATETMAGSELLARQGRAQSPETRADKLLKMLKNLSATELLGFSRDGDSEQQAAAKQIQKNRAAERARQKQTAEQDWEP